MSSFFWFKGGDSQATEGDVPHQLAKGKKKVQFGLKELAAGKDSVVDIVAIHGIDGDREHSWTADNGVLWLRDLLPEKIPDARILTYGYDTNIHSQERLATDYMNDHTKIFITALALFREETFTSDQPIIFVAHSLGGLLLKSALIHSHLCHNDHLEHHHHAVSHSAYGVAFFSTPQGAAVAELARFFLDAGSYSIQTSNILRYIERDSEGLQQQLALYPAISTQYETKFFYELYDTPIAKGVSKRVVPESFAVVPGAVNAEAVGIHKDHINMIRYRSADDDDFMTVSTTLSLMSKAAHKKMREKCSTHKSPEVDITTSTEIVLSPLQQSAPSSLPCVHAALFYADSRRHCLEGTRVDLLSAITEWIEQDILGVHRRIFWLCGQAGTGKTTISLTVASSCEENDCLSASFFFSRDHVERSDLQLVFPTLAQELGIFHPPFQLLLAKVLEQEPDVVHMEPGYQFKKLIVDPLKSCDSFPASTIIVIDALDECKDQDPISKMLSILAVHIHELPRLKFFITSRPEDHIREGFYPLFTQTRTFILHNMETSVVDADIELYLRNGFTLTSGLYWQMVPPDWPSDEAVKSLVQQSGGLFIFAATALAFIQDPMYSDPLNQLSILLGQPSAINSSSSSPFTFLDQLYLQVLRQAFPSRTTLPDRLGLLRKLLSAIVLLCDPLSPGALEIFLNLRSGLVRFTLRHLHSIIDVPDSDDHPIRLIHPSFFDFATSRCSDADFRIDHLVCHEQLAIACFRQMKGLKQNICETEDASKLNSEIADLVERIKRSISPAMQYACLHWTFHLCTAGRDTLQGMLRGFCHGQILYWIEALSLLGYLREGIRQLQDLSKFLNTLSALSKDLLESLSDITGFMVDHFELMTCASLQLYRSALPLSAPSSFLRKTFHHDLNGGMRVLQGEQVHKSSNLTILRGSKAFVTSVNFSLDGTLIVSASDNEVRLWDCGTGTLLRKMDAGPNSNVIWARFFPDGSRIMAGTFKYTIPIWDVATGACLQTIHLENNIRRDVGLEMIPNCYAISPDFTHIVGSTDANIDIWHTSNGYLLKTLNAHNRDSNLVTSVAFSPDHMLIASASGDYVHVWDAIEGAALRTLKGHSRSVYTITFSSDSKHIISGSWDNDIRLWDVTRDASSRTMKGHTHLVLSVAFSPDDQCVISGSLDKTLRIWNTTNGELLKTIRCSWRVENVGFSPDGKQYISSIGDIIYIWDADRASDLDQSDELVEEVNFSPDGTYITGKTNRKTHHLWDGVTGTHLITLDSTMPTIFSPDNKYFLSSPDGKDLCLWDTATRATLWTTQLESHSDNYCVTFSSDSTRIISTSRDHLIRIWDVADGNDLFTISSHSCSSASFNNDGSRIITENGRYYIPPYARPNPILSTDESLPVEQIQYLLKGEWVFASNGYEEERCVWIPSYWRSLNGNYSSSHGRVAIGTRHGLALLDLSGIDLSIEF